MVRPPDARPYVAIVALALVLSLGVFAVASCVSETPPPAAPGTIGSAELPVATTSGIRPATLAEATTTLTNCTVPDLTVDAEEWAFFDLLNAYRAQTGHDDLGRPISQLIMSANLNRAASWMSADLGSRADHVFSHVDSLGRAPDRRRLDCGNPSPGYGENIAGGYDSAQRVFDAWKASPGHNANMLTWDAVQVGIARVVTPGSPYGVYWTTDDSWADDGTRIARDVPTATPAPSVTSVPNATATKTATPPKPTATLKPTLTPKPTATPFPYRCQRQTGGGWVTLWTRPGGGVCP